VKRETTSSTAGQSIGGICGQNINSSQVNNCYSAATVINKATQIYNCIGVNNSSATVTNCYYNNGTTTDGTEVTGYGTGKSSANMKLPAFVTTLNSGVTNYQSDILFGENYGYPIFTTQTAKIANPYKISNGEEVIIKSTTQVAEIPNTITIKDGGSLINNGDASLLKDKTINVERQLKAGAWNLVGSVLNNNTMNALNNNVGVTMPTYKHDMVAVDYDYSNNKWNTTYLYNSDNFTSGKGYFVYPLNRYITAGASNYTDISSGQDGYGEYIILTQTKSSGALTLNTSNIDLSSLSLTNNGAATYNSQSGLTKTTGKWFALSNPFTGKISVKSLCNTIVNEQGESAIYTYNATSGKWEIATYVYPGQGFMMASAIESGTGSNAVYYTSLTGSIALTNQGNKSNVEEETPSYITFTTQANNTTKEAFARIDESASNSFDNKDAYVLLSNDNEDLVEPYFLVDNHTVMKDIFKTMPYIAPINFHADKISNTTLTTTNIPDDVNVSIVDLSSGEETILENNSSYSFVANQGENEGRFVVKFAKDNVSIENQATRGKYLFINVS
jgi:hypothetical protein